MGSIYHLMPRVLQQREPESECADGGPAQKAKPSTYEQNLRRSTFIVIFHPAGIELQMDMSPNCVLFLQTATHAVLPQHTNATNGCALKPKNHEFGRQVADFRSETSAQFQLTHLASTHREHGRKEDLRLGGDSDRNGIEVRDCKSVHPTNREHTAAHTTALRRNPLLKARISWRADTTIMADGGYNLFKLVCRCSIKHTEWAKTVPSSRSTSQRAGRQTLSELQKGNEIRSRLQQFGRSLKLKQYELKFVNKRHT